MLSTRHEIFLEVAQKNSFSKASETLFISQPAITKHIKLLEAYYKTPLFERKGSKIILTPVGELLFKKLNEVKKIQNQLEFEVSVINKTMNAKGQLKLGASTTVALYFLPKILSAFHKQYPNIKISLLNRNTDTIIEALQQQEIDIGIVEGKKKSTAVLYKHFVADEVVAVCNKNSLLAKKKTITLKEMLEYPIVLRELGSGTLAALKDNLLKNGIKIADLDVKVRLGGTEALKNFIKEDDSLGFLPKVSVKRELLSGELVAIKIEGFEIIRDFFFIQRHGSENNDLNKLFIKTCQQSV